MANTREQACGCRSQRSIRRNHNPGGATNHRRSGQREPRRACRLENTHHYGVRRLRLRTSMLYTLPLVNIWDTPRLVRPFLCLSSLRMFRYQSAVETSERRETTADLALTCTPSSLRASSRLLLRYLEAPQTVLGSVLPARRDTKYLCSGPANYRA